MTSTAVSLKGLQLLQCDPKDFLVWWIHAENFFAIDDLGMFWSKTKYTGLPVTAEVTKSTTDAEKTALARHGRYMGFMTHALVHEDLSVIVAATRSKDWPQGEAHLVHEGLSDKFFPGDMVANASLGKQLAAIPKGREQDDPTLIFAKVNHCLAWFPSHNKTEEDLLEVVISKLPRNYMNIMYDSMRQHGSKLTRALLMKDLNSYYRLLQVAGGAENGKKAAVSESDDEDTEVALVAFSGQCFNCKKMGHKAADCRSNKTKGNGNYGAGKFKGKCNNCNKIGHKAENCWLLEKNASKRPANWKKNNSNSSETAAMDVIMCAAKDHGLVGANDLIMYDTAATVHVMNSKIGAINVVNKDRKAIKADKTVMTTSQVGDYPLEFFDKAGNKMMSGTLSGATISPDGVNLFAATQMFKKGWSQGGNDESLWMESPDRKIKLVFDIKIDSPEGSVYCARIKPRMQEVAAAAVTTVQQLHSRLGHCGEDATKKSAEQLGIELAPGQLGVCESCAIGKARQKNVPKATELETRDDDAKRRVYMDIASIKNKKGQAVVLHRHWHMMVIGGINLKFSAFYKQKSGMIEKTCEKLKHWQQHNLGVDIVRMDNAKENKKLKARIESAEWQLPAEVEFTARATPQQNSAVETGFAVIADRSRAMMVAAKVPKEWRRKLFPFAANTATDLDGLLAVEWKGKVATRYEHWCGKNPAFAKHLRTWGEAGVVTIKSTRTTKVDDRGKTCMMVGYAKEHDGNVYKMWHKDSGVVYETRDVVWLRKMYFTGKVDEDEEIRRELRDVAEASDVDDVEFEVEEGINPVESDNSTAKGVQVAAAPKKLTELSGPEKVAVKSLANTVMQRVTRSGRVVKPTEKMAEWQAALQKETDKEVAEPSEIERELVQEPDDSAEIASVMCTMQPEEVVLCDAEEIFYDSLADIEPEFSCVGAGIGGGFTDTSELHVMKYDEAMHMADEKEVEEWHDAVAEEKERMDKHGVFQAVPMSEVPEGAKILTSTWAMKKKANGKKRARLNARGFEQVDGEHYNEDDKAAPVVTLSAIMVILTLIVMLDWTAELCDVNGAFLLGDFGAELNMFMFIPQGFEKYYPKDFVLKLLRPIYGCRQSAKRFWIKLLTVLNLMKFMRGAADPCVYFKWGVNGLVLIASWVDDLLICGKKQEVLNVKKELFSHLQCDDVGELTEYVGCKIVRDKDSIQLTQPVLIQSFQDEFNLPGKLADVKTPAPAGQILVKGPVEVQVDAAEQSVYRSGVGKLMHLMRWSKPVILNSVRELSRFFSGATVAHLQAMYQVMSYCVKTSSSGRTLRPERKCDESELKEFEFRIKGRSDSNYASDPESRRSVTGYTVFFEGAPTATKSKMQECVTMSVTEAEYVSAADCAQEMLFQKHLLESLGLKVELPMILEIDNKGAIDLANNWSATGRTKHVDVRHHFLRDLKEDGIMKFKWIGTADNSSDLFTKNLGGALFAKHAAVYEGDHQLKEEGVASRGLKT